MDLQVDDILHRSKSNDSISSINSNSSTGRFVERINSKDFQFDDHTESQMLDDNTRSEKSYKIPKKPVKFTVRKVSREPLDSCKIDNSHETDKKIKVLLAKYDQYVQKVDKIKKEINFLKKLLPPYNVEIDYHTRVKITRAIEKLDRKIDEINKKKYNLGVTLSRLNNDGDDRDMWVESVGN